MKYYYIEDSGGPTPMYTWMNLDEILGIIEKVSKKKNQSRNEKFWGRALKKHIPHWKILDTMEE